jgi:AcrR family transcriptional regulator
MAMSAPEALRPRKAPRQARSAVTVAAILEAAVQVLLAEGAARFTTTRVAVRAGVSVGTMYQYFPHKQALLYAVLKQHLEEVAQAVEAACRRDRGKTLAAISDGLAAAYLEAKTRHFAASQALYLVASELDTGDLLGWTSQRMVDAIQPLLASASDATIDDLAGVTFALRATLSGTVRSILARGADPARVETLRQELPVICRAYLAASARPRTAAAV